VRLRRFAFVSLLVVASAHGATFTVNSTADATDAQPGDGVCETAPGNGVCTLRAAIQETNALLGADTIVLPAGTYTLTLPHINASFFDPDSSGGALDISDDVTITGAGAASTIVQGGATLATAVDRVFTVGLPAGASHIVTISGVTIMNGSGGGAEGCFGGGGILNYYGTSLTLTDVVITGNNGGVCGFGGMMIDRSTISNNATKVLGGGVVAVGDMTIRNSTISGNRASDAGIGLGAFGGGVFLFQNGSNRYSITNSTISGNSADTAGGGIYVVSGLGNNVANTTFFNNVTVTGNSAATGGGITACRSALGEIFCSGQTVAPLIPAGAIKNSVIGGNSGGNCGDRAIDPFAAPASAGHNVEDADTCGFAAAGDRPNASTLLGPLAFNGGPTQTHALLAGSAAIDAGDPAGCSDDLGAALTADQRGLTRTAGTNCDAGAYEAQQSLGGSSATSGSVTFTTSAGVFGSLDAVAVADIPTPPPSGVSFPFGLFSWTLTGLTPGQTVTLTLTYPSPVASPAKYYKVASGAWTDASALLGSDNGDNVLTLTVTDGGAGDSDGVANGQISDPGGVGIGTAFSAFTAAVNLQKRELGITATFQLAAASNGIDPVRETTQLQVGVFGLTIPPQSFRADGKGGFAFQGTVNGVKMEATIRSHGKAQFDLQAQIHGADVAPISSPTVVKLAIGDDAGAVSVTPRVSP